MGRQSWGTIVRDLVKSTVLATVRKRDGAETGGTKTEDYVTDGVVEVPERKDALLKLVP